MVLSNDESSADSNYALTVRLPAERPAFKRAVQDQTIPVGQRLEIIIEVSRLALVFGIALSSTRNLVFI